MNSMAVFNASAALAECLRPVFQWLCAEKAPHTHIHTPPLKHTLGELSQACYFSRIDLSAHSFYATPTLHNGHPFAYLLCTAAVSEVEVNCLTGNSKVVRADLLYHTGASINHQIDIDQVEGAYVQVCNSCSF